MISDHIYGSLEIAVDDSDDLFDTDGIGNNEEELVKAVSQKPYLFDKKHPSYLNGELKARAWSSIGAQLPSPLNMLDPEKLFYKLLQRFGKERKKVRDSTPGAGSGAGIPVYKPEWPLYDELMYLAPHVQTRERISTNYKAGGLGSILKENQFVPGLSINKRGTGRGASSSRGIPRSSGMPSLVMDAGEVPGQNQPRQVICRPLSQVSQSATVEDVGNLGEIIFDEGDVYFAHIDNMDFSTTEVPHGNDSHVSTATATTNSSGPSASMKFMEPDSDSSYKKRKRKVDKINKNIEESSKGINRLASNLSSALAQCVSGAQKSSSNIGKFGNFSSSIQAMLASLGLALDKVDTKDQMDCVTDLLNLVNKKYLKKE